MRRGWQWPLLIGLALAFTVGVNVAMLFAAGADPNGTVVEADYYRKAVEWDRTMARRAASDALGWRATGRIGAIAAGSREVALTLQDAAGAPLVGAEVGATLIHNREAAAPVSVPLVEQGNGRYVAMAPLWHRGMWEVRIVARRGAERFETSQRVEAP